MRLGVILAIVCAALGLFGAGLLAAAVWLLAASAGADVERLGMFGRITTSLEYLVFGAQ